MAQNKASLPVAVDAAGGDNGIDVQVEGVVQAFREYGACSIIVGDETAIRARIGALGATDIPISIAHAPQVITMDESPTRAVRRKPDSSLCVAYELVESGKASSVISAGNSGAMMAAGRLICGLLPGIERPAIATVIPVVGDATPNVILDTGANVDCHAHNLVQFAIMGSIYYTSLFNKERPRVGLLSNGEESGKGTDVTRAAALVLSRIESMNYIGYVEGRDLSTDKAAVIICDGFVGNIVLKTMEGCARLVAKQLRLEAKRGILARVGMGLARNTFRQVFEHKFDYTTYGGSPLLGLQKLALVLHGSSDARAVKNAIRVADVFAGNKMTSRISNEITHFEEKALDLDDDILNSVLSKRRAARGNNNSKGHAKEKTASESADVSDKTKGEP